MKKYIVAILTTMILCSCDSSKEKITKEDLIGIWQIEKVNFESEKDEDKLKVELTKMRHLGKGNTFYSVKKGNLIDITNDIIIYDNTEYLEGTWDLKRDDSIKFSLLPKNGLGIVGFDKFTKFHIMKIEFQRNNNLLILSERLDLGILTMSLRRESLK
jgi:hypothetical protein